MASSWYSLIAFLASLSICLLGTLYTRAEIAQENMKKLANANNYLAFNIYRELSSSRSSGNVFFSPLSLSVAFGMLFYGTRGNAAKELRNALGYENAHLPDGLVHQAFHEYLTDVLPSRNSSAYTLNSANLILLDKNLNTDSSYVRVVQDLYQSMVKEVDFARDSRKIVGEVNSWVKANTNGKIDKLLDSLDPTTILAILNAIYFKGTWKTEFDPIDTRQRTFYNKGLESQAKVVSMMHVLKEFNYASIEGAQAIELPYKGENISMIVLLPNKRDGLQSLERSLTLEKLSAVRNRMHSTKVYLYLPKFKVEYSREMSNDFKSLGAESIFNPGADFSGITSSKNIYVSQVLHKAVVEVTEEGSEAAAVTLIISNRNRPMIDPTPSFYPDHPFLFTIVDKRSGMILFAGRVTDL